MSSWQAYNNRLRQKVVPYPRSIFLALFLLSLIFSAGQIKLDINMVANLMGADSYLRLLTLNQLLTGSDWYDHIIQRTNWPDGLEHHWTRPVDLLMLPFVSMFSTFTAALIYQFCLLLIFAWGMVLSAWRLGANFSNLVLPTIILAIYSNSYLLGYFLPGRIDHHALLCTLFVWVIYSLLTQRVLLAGVLAGFGVWVSVEFFVPLFFVSLWLGWSWLKTPEEYHATPRQFFFPMLLMMSIGILFERPPAEFSRSIIDSLSAPHLFLIGLTCFASILLAQPASWKCGFISRLLQAGFYGGSIFALTFVLFPELLQLGFTNMTDPLIVEHFGEHVGELKSPFEAGYGLSPFIALLLAVPVGIMRLKSQRWPSIPLLLLITALGTHALLLDAFRWIYYAIPSALLLLVYGLSDPKWEARRTLRMLIIFALITLPLLLILKKENTVETHRSNPCTQEMNQLIRENLLGEQPLALAINPNRGYETLFFTPHRILAANNHRNEAGLGDLLRVLHAEHPATAYEIITRRKIDVIAACPDYLNPNSYLHSTPQWLSLHPLSNKIQALKIWAVKFPE